MAQEATCSSSRLNKQCMEGRRAAAFTLLTFVEEDIWVFTPPSCAALAVFTNHYSEPDAITPITSLAPSA
jgi:hypothetical protein